MNKKQIEAVTKAFRLLAQAASEGEHMLYEKGDAMEVFTHIEGIMKHLGVMKDAIGDHLGAQMVLSTVAKARPRAAGKVGRPKLSIVR